MLSVPFNRAAVAPRQLEYLEQSFASGHLAGDGPFTERFVGALSGMLGTDRVLLTPSCTAALEMSAILLDLEPGDEVIVPSFSFVSSANAFALMGARPVFADVDPETLNIDPVSVKRLLGDRTRALVAVHYGGRPCEMDALGDLAEQVGAAVVEDAAHALFARVDGVHVGRRGALSTFSFHETKNLSCGEGGALVVNDASLWERARVVREKGTDRTRFRLGQVDKYTWIDRGSSYLLADPLAAVLLAQVEHAPVTQDVRRTSVEAYRRELAGWAVDRGVQMPPGPGAGEDEAYHLMPLLFADSAARDAFLLHCAEGGVQSVFHYLPLHRSRMGRSLGAEPDSCPVADSVSARLARLPVYSDMLPDELDLVLDVVGRFTP
jgi:dTDP-4-amino-4,6-dideoxygalactose transaminase